MNPLSTAPSVFRTAPGRAQFSPVSRRFAQEALMLRRLRAQLLHDRRVAVSAGGDDTAPTRLVRPHLLDELNPPLTRFRD